MGKEILRPHQVDVLDAVARHPDFVERVYFTGGTALAAFYLNHRESEDLDFFSAKEIDPLAVEVFFRSVKKGLGFRRIEFQRSFNRNIFFLHFRDGVLKTEFTYFPFTPLEEGKRYGKLRVDSLKDIAVNKVHALSERPRARDFVDLFFILRKRKWTLRSLIREVRAKFDVEIDLIHFGAQLLRAQEAKDFPRMIAPLNRKELNSFFLQQAASLEKKVLS